MNIYTNDVSVDGDDAFVGVLGEFVVTPLLEHFLRPFFCTNQIKTSTPTDPKWNKPHHDNRHDSHHGDILEHGETFLVVHSAHVFG